MTKLLYVRTSPRGEASKSIQIADAYLAAYREAHPDALIETVDLWELGLPEFDGDSAASKMSFFGEAGMTDKQKAIYAELVRLFEQFNSADDYLFAIPMWNFGVPYKLKQYIDLLSMPGTLFGFDPAEGYIGLLKGKRATAVYSAAIYHDGAPKAFGTDYVSTYFTDWLNFAGISDVETIWYQKYKMVSAEDADARLEAAKDLARSAARRAPANT
jgi:FMN-dependent NADH-azoreductase